jgi:hypothetical protein
MLERTVARPVRVPSGWLMIQPRSDPGAAPADCRLFDQVSGPQSSARTRCLWSAAAISATWLESYPRRIFCMPTDSVIRRTESKNTRRAPVAKLVLLVSVIAGMRCDAHLSYLYCRPITVNVLTIGRLSGNLTCNSIHVGAI